MSPCPQQIYIGGLDPDTTPVNVMDYVLKYIGIRVPCVQLRNRGDSYASFMISVDKTHLERVFNAALWPSEAIIDFYKPPRSNRRQNDRRFNNRRDNQTSYRFMDNNDDTDKLYYSMKYNEQVYSEEDYNDYYNTGRDMRYQRK